MLIDLGPWNFEFQRNSVLDRINGTIEPDRFPFRDAKEMLEFLALEDGTDRGRFQRLLQDRLKENVACRQWTKARGKLSELRHFARYRKSEYEAYHAAARAVAAGTADAGQTEMVQGLTAEVDASRVTLPAGQQVFHGRSEPFAAGQAYPSFISTSLEPVVSVNHSYKRPGPGRRPQVYILTPTFDIPAIWGHSHGVVEWELLLPPGLIIVEKSRSDTGEFDVVTADIVARESPAGQTSAESQP